MPALWLYFLFFQPVNHVENSDDNNKQRGNRTYQKKIPLSEPGDGDGWDSPVDAGHLNRTQQEDHREYNDNCGVN